MIVIYCATEEMDRLVAKVKAAYPGKAITARSSRDFEAADADPTDLLVYCADYARDAKAACADLPGVTVLPIGSGPLAMAPADLIAAMPDAMPEPVTVIDEPQPVETPAYVKAGLTKREAIMQARQARQEATMAPGKVVVELGDMPAPKPAKASKPKTEAAK